jgi:hypothetical protein
VEDEGGSEDLEDDDDDGTEATAVPPSFEAHAIPTHHTATSDESWDGPANEGRIKGTAEQIDKAMREFSAWEDSARQSPKPKSAFKFGHHLVDDEGKVGAADIRACQNGIGVLNGARGGTKIPTEDRQGVYDHLAAHLRDAGKTPTPLKSAEDATAAVEAAEQAPAEPLSFAGGLALSDLRA